MPHTPTLSEPRVRSTAPGLHAGTLSCESLRHQSDERLVALARAGSERAFAEITRRYQRRLRAYCSRIVGGERAQDAVQQALLQAFLSLRDGAPREIALRPWLYRIAHNCSIDLLRMTSWEYDQLDLEFDGVPQPPALFEQKEELRGLVAGMMRLPDAQRQALMLRELEGCSYEEISARLGHTGSGVRQLIFRARTTLRKGAAVLVPFGLIRDRLLGFAPALETNQVASAAAVPASSGGGMETVGAAALAVVAMMGGVAGSVRSGQDRRAPEARGAHTAGSGVAVPGGRMFSAPMLAPAGSPRARRAATDDGAPAAGAAPAVQPAGAAVEPVTPLAAAQAPAPAAPEEPPASAPVEPTDSPAAVDQQSLTAAPSPGAPSQEPPAAAPDQAQSAPAAPAAGTPGPARSQNKSSAPRPTKPRPVTKPRPPAVPPAAVPKPAGRPAPPAVTGRPQKAANPPARPKKSGPAAVPAAAPR
jgi:RNA polymerase sigma factor (sigma-70 family)